MGGGACSSLRQGAGDERLGAARTAEAGDVVGIACVEGVDASGATDGAGRDGDVVVADGAGTMSDPKIALSCASPFGAS